MYDALGLALIHHRDSCEPGPVQPLPDITGSHWFSECRQETRSSGGLACLVRDSLQSRISITATDEFSRFMWVQVRYVYPLP